MTAAVVSTEAVTLEAPLLALPDNSADDTFQTKVKSLARQERRTHVHETHNG